MKKKMFIPIPQPEVYYGINITNKIKLEYENESVKQRIDNLVLYTTQDM